MSKQYSIIIPCYNTKDTLEELLVSIISSSNADQFEIIVVDDGSTDGTYRAIQHYPVRVIRSEINKGSAHARNIGAFYAKTPFLIFFDADIIIQSDTLEKLIACIAGNPKNHVYMGIYSHDPVHKSFVSMYKAMLDTWHWQNIKTNAVTSFEPRCAIMHKSLFEKVGGFDETFEGADVEDYELGYRLLALGTILYVNTDIKVHHHFPMTGKELLKTMFRRSMSWAQLFVHRKQFDNVASTPEAALSCGIAGWSILLWPLIFYDCIALLFFLALLCLFGYLVSGFFVQVKNYYGFWIGIRLLVLHYMVCGVIFFGGVTGLFCSKKQLF